MQPLANCDAQFHTSPSHPWASGSYVLMLQQKSLGHLPAFWNSIEIDFASRPVPAVGVSARHLPLRVMVIKCNVRNLLAIGSLLHSVMRMQGRLANIFFGGSVMRLPRRKFLLHLAAGAAALPALSRIARAQAYPSRPVRIVVPFAPAGAADTVARIMAQWLSERLGRPFVVENRPGAGTNIGTEAVVRAPADGYTLLM